MILKILITVQKMLITGALYSIAIFCAFKDFKVIPAVSGHIMLPHEMNVNNFYPCPYKLIF